MKKKFEKQRYPRKAFFLRSVFLPGFFGRMRVVCKYLERDLFYAKRIHWSVENTCENPGVCENPEKYCWKHHKSLVNLSSSWKMKRRKNQWNWTLILSPHMEILDTSLLWLRDAHFECLIRNDVFFPQKNIFGVNFQAGKKNWSESLKTKPVVLSFERKKIDSY